MLSTATTAPAVLWDLDGIGGVRFGSTPAQAQQVLERQLGPPASRTPTTDLCSTTYQRLSWGEDLVLIFDPDGKLQEFTVNADVVPNRWRLTSRSTVADWRRAFPSSRTIEIGPGSYGLHSSDDVKLYPDIYVEATSSEPTAHLSARMRVFGENWTAGCPE